MQNVILVVAGIIIGGIAGWLIGVYRARVESFNKITEAERRGSEAETRLAVIQSQLQQAIQEQNQLRQKLEQEQANRITAETTLKETQLRLAEQQKFLDEAKEKLSETFKALAGDTLNTTHTTFLNMSREGLEKILLEASSELAKRHDEIKTVVTPLAEALKQYKEHISNIEKKRIEAYSSLEMYLKTLTQTQQQLQKETSQLVNALRSSSQVRGKWGEVTLRRLVEMAGMNQYSDFSIQQTIKTEEGKSLRPDLIVRLPSNRIIVVDAKVSLEAYLNAISCDDEDSRKKLFKEHVQNIKNQINTLGNKAYWKSFQQTPEFVVMFIPADSFLNVALEFEPQLLEEAFSHRVILATPSILMALLLTVAYGWRQEQIAQNTEQLYALGKELYGRFQTFYDNFRKIGKGLESAVEAFNSTVSGLETRLLPSARRFVELGISKGTEIPPMEQINVQPQKIRENE